MTQNRLFTLEKHHQLVNTPMKIRIMWGINIISPCCNLANVTLISTSDANQLLLIIDRMDHWINCSQ